MSEGRTYLKALAKGALLVTSLALAVGISEATLRALSPNIYSVWEPGRRWTSHPMPGVMPGVEGSSELTINSMGFRGDEWSPELEWRILALGGSTTECAYLDNSEAWPYLVQQALNAASGDSVVWVGNAGRSGLNTRHHRVQVEKLLPQHPEIDTLVLMASANDFLTRLGRDRTYVPLWKESARQRQHVFDKALRVRKLETFAWSEDEPYYRRTALWQRLRVSFGGTREGEHSIQDGAGRIYVRWRELRRDARMRNELPDLSEALTEYRNNLDYIVDTSRAHGVVPVLVTQPTMWRSGLPEDLERLLWMGGVGPSPRPGVDYYSVEALAAGIRQYNEILLDVCRAKKLTCLDLAPLLPKDQRSFYDDLHFNERGSRAAAESIARVLQGLPRAREIAN